MNSKKMIGMFALLLAFISAHAQNTLKGTLFNQETDEVLPGVSVFITDLNKGAVSDFDGNYQIQNLKPGHYLVELKLTGFKTRSQEIQIRQDTVINFRLAPSVTELNEVIVTGVTRSTERKRSPIIIQTIDQEAFKQNSATNLIDGLKNIPGISQITTGAAVSKPLIRGLGFNRVLSLNNGIRQEGQQWGDEHGIEIDEYAVDRVEIIKGPGSLIYGSDGIAGVLNFLPPKPLSEGTIKTQLTSNYQSNNNLLGHSLVNTGNENGFQWLGRFTNKLADPYKNKYDGKVYNSGFKEYNGNLFLGLNRDWGYTQLTLNSYNTTLGIVEGERDEQGHFIYEDKNGDIITAGKRDYKGYNIGFPQQKINHFSVASNNYFMLKKGSVKADLGFQSNNRREYEEAAHPEDAELHLNLKTLTYNIRYNFNKVNNWEITTGISGMQQNNTNKGEEFLIPNYRLFDIGAFLFIQKTYEKLTLAGGLRIDNRHLNSKDLFLDEDDEITDPSTPDAEQRFSALHKNFTGFSGSAGLSYQVSDHSTLKLNLSRGYRAPNIAELSSNGVHEGTFRYEIGNAALKPEYSNQIDLGYYLDTKHVTMELTPFVNFMENYIYIQRLDENPQPADPGVNYYEYTADNATLYGGELYLDIHPHPLDWLHLAQYFSYVRGQQKQVVENTRNLPSIPAAKYRGEINTKLRNLSKALSHSYVKLSFDYYFKQDQIFSAYDTETATPGYALINLGIGTDIAVFNKKDFLQLSVNAENLGDKAYQNHLSRLKYAPENPATGRPGVFNMGRNFSFKLTVNI